MNEDAEIVSEFLVESHENLDQLDRDLVELEQRPGSRDLLSSIFRTIHTIKGTCGFLAFHNLEAVAHAGENLLSRLRDGEMTMTEGTAEVLLHLVDCVRDLLVVVEQTGSDVSDGVDVERVVAAVRQALDGQVEPVEPTPATPPALGGPDGPEAHPGTDAHPGDAAPDDEPADAPRRGITDASVRVDVELLDSLVQLVGELVLTRNQIVQQAESADDIELSRASQRLDLVASELQENVMRTRMQPIGHVWAKLPRIVRDLSHQLGRKVVLDMTGHDTELDRSLLEALRDPLVHLVRNAMDHGFETPAARVRAGKPETGRLSVRAYHESGQVIVEISDDGQGIDPVVIGEAAVRRGVVNGDTLARMDPREIVQLVFRPGFSTATEVTNVSGRGVGMDVVRTNIERIGGSVDLSSRPGAGTTCRVRIPLTLAIIPALVVGENGERYAIPQVNLVELVRLEGEELSRKVEVLAGSPVLRLRGRLLPLLHLADALGVVRANAGTLTLVVLQADDVRFALAVEEVHDTQEIVVKPIGRQLKTLPMYAGATIMGDGRVALILDALGLAQAHGIDAAAVHEAEAPAVAAELTSLLVLEVASGRRAALPLTDVSRLEEFRLDRVERTGGHEVVQYRDGILPLVRLAGAIGLVETPVAREELSVVVHDDGGHRVGIVIDRVLDIVATTLVTSAVGRRAGVLGSAVVQDRVTDLVDLDAVVALANAGAA